MNDQSDLLRVSLSNPLNGWIDFEVVAAGIEFKTAVSYTPNDFILELTTALSLVMQNAGAAVVAFCEPVTYELQFAVSPRFGHGQFQITKYPDSHKNKRTANAVLSICGERRGIVLPFWRALRNLEGRVSATEYREAMLRDFPTSCLQRLSQLVSDQRSRD